MNGVANGRSHRYALNVATTSVSNVASAVAAGIAGIIIARSLGSSVRGEYAAIMVWFGVVLSVGQLGQTAATTFFVAQDPRRARDYLATSRNMMIASGGVTLAVGILSAPMLASGNAGVTWGYRLMFATCLASFVGASYTFSLQASNIARWNLVRVSQPVVFLGVIAVLHLAGRLELMITLAALSITIVAQTALAYWLCSRHGLAGGRADLALARPMARYGLGQLAASVPTVITTRLDQLVLSLAVAPAALGGYAVATSLTGIAVPIAAALGEVAFPQFASLALSLAGMASLQRRALAASALVGIALMLPLAGLAPWIVPAVFGAGYQDVVLLVVLLAPGGVFLACGQVCGDVLRGYGQPFALARAQAMAAGLTILLLATLVPLLGVIGAAVASSAAAGAGLLLMLRALRRVTATVAAPLPTGAAAQRVGAGSQP